MRSLLEMQRDFGAALLDAAKATVMPRGFAVYVSNVYGNRTKALAAAYPIVRKIVGESFFDGLARAYARRYPSASGDLNELGARLPGFVAGFSGTQDLPYLPDVARMEWLAHRAYYAADAARFDPARLAAIPPEEHATLKLARSPGSALLASEWPLARLWTVHQDDYAGELSVDFQPGLKRILIHRPRWHVKVQSVAPGDYRFLAEANRGVALGDALQTAADADPEFDAASALSRWVREGVVTL